jgi:hypothetical protein
MTSRILRRLSHPVSLFGLLIAVLGFGASLFALVVELLHGSSSPYQGILTFLVFPSFLFLGLAIVILGGILEGRRMRRLEARHVPWTPLVDPSVQRQRRILFVLAGFGALITLFSLLGSYHAFEFTESTTFCGEACHVPMEPQYVAYQHSPHASIGCVACHVGPGVAGFVEAKLAGLNQVYQMVGDSYPRPIVANHRKAEITSEACERCHWDQKRWGPRISVFSHFGYDLGNTRRSLHLLTRPMGKRAVAEGGARRHWHDTNDRITFRAADERKQTIPWVKVVRADGTTTTYEDREWQAKNAAAPLLAETRMECVDCHSRPAHQIPSPDHAVNEALSEGRIDRSLPSIKRAAVAALSSRQEGPAADGMRKAIESFYTEHFQGAVLNRKESLEGAARELAAIRRRTVFPAMGVDWSTHPDHSGHRESPCCFRCHGGRHTSQDGKTISAECDTCHLFYERQQGSFQLTELPADTSTLHPFSWASHAKIECWSCHGGASSPYASCQGCHEGARSSHSMQFECSVCHAMGGAKVASAKCGPCHPAGQSALHAHKDHGDCLSCHAPHQWAVAAAERCAPCHGQIDSKPLAEHYPGKSCSASDCHDFRGVLSQMQGLPAGGNQPSPAPK